MRAALLSQEVASLERKLDDFDDTLRKSIPEIERRMLHLVSGKLEAFELGIARRMHAAQDQLKQDLARANARNAMLLSLVLLILAVLLFRV